MRRWGTAVLVLVIGAWPALALAQSTFPKIGFVATLRGAATATRAPAPEPLPLKFRDDVFLRDSILTGVRSLGRFLLGGGHLLTVGERTRFRLLEDSVSVDDGKVLVLGGSGATGTIRAGDVTVTHGDTPVIVEHSGPNVTVSAPPPPALPPGTPAPLTSTAGKPIVISFPGRPDISSVILPTGSKLTWDDTVLTITPLTTPEILRIQADFRFDTFEHVGPVNTASLAALHQEIVRTNMAVLDAGFEVLDSAGVWAPGCLTSCTLPGGAAFEPGLVIPADRDFSEGRSHAFTFLAMTGGRLSGSDDVVLDSSSTWTGGTMAGAGSTSFNGSLTLGGALILDGRTLKTAGTTTWSDGSLRLLNGAVVNNTGLWVAQGNDLTLTATVPGTFNNDGTLRVSGSLTMADRLVNRGAVEVPDGGSLRLLRAAESSGSVFLGRGARLELSGTGTTAFGGAVVIDGVLSIDAHRVSTSGTTTWRDGRIELSGGAAISNSGLWSAAGSGLVLSAEEVATFTNTGTFRASGLVELRDNFINTGTIDVTDGSTFRLSRRGDVSARVSIGPDATLELSGRHTLGGAVSGAGSLRALGFETRLETDRDAPLQIGSDTAVTVVGTPLRSTGVTIAVDTALVTATAPLLALTTATTTSTRDVIQLVQRAKLDVRLTAGALVRLDAATLAMTGGSSLVHAGGASFVSIVGDLVSLTNGSTLTVSGGGGLATVSGGSVFRLTGSLATLGEGRNTLVLSDSSPLCPGCRLLVPNSDIPAFRILLRNGATARNVVLRGDFEPFDILGDSGNSVRVEGNGAPLILDGSRSRVILVGPPVVESRRQRARDLEPTGSSARSVRPR